MSQLKPGLTKHPCRTVPEQETLKAVLDHVGLDHPEEARCIYVEAQKGNMVAQFIVGIALGKTGRAELAETWFRRSAAQRFAPAVQHLKKAG